MGFPRLYPGDFIGWVPTSLAFAKTPFPFMFVDYGGGWCFPMLKIAHQGKVN